MRYVKRADLNKPKKDNSKAKKIILSILGVLVLGGIVALLLLPFLDSGKPNPLYNGDYVYENGALNGTWREESYDEYYYQTYSFDNDGIVTLSSYYYGIKEASISGKYSVSDKNLITIIYNEGADNQKTEENRFSILSDGRLVMKTLGQSGETELVMTKNSTKYNQDSSIFGKWSMTSDGVTVSYTFNENHTGTIEDSTGAKDTFVYSTTEDNLYWIYTITYKDTPPIFSGDILPYKYSIEGNSLILTVSTDGQSITHELIKE